MSLSLALNNALTGLNVAQRSLGVLSHNIANANTAGYSRQIVDQTPRYVGGEGQGVTPGEISRRVDKYLQRAIQSQSSDLGASAATSDYMERLQVLMGEPGAKNSLNAYTDTFFSALQGLALTPEVASLRTNAVNSGASLARNINSLARSVYDLRYQADQDIKQSISHVNSLINNLYNLNTEIGRAVGMGNSTAGLEDERDRLVNELAQEIDVKLDIKEDGQVHIYTANGIALLDASSTQITYNSAQSVDVFINNTALGAIEVTRIDSNGTPAGSLQTLVSSGREGEITSLIRGGKLKALVELRDESLVDVLAQLDTFAAQIRDEINAVHNDGSGYPGTNALTGTRLVAATDKSQWSGSVMIAALSNQGRALTSPYADERASGTGLRPLTLDLSQLDSGFGQGLPTNQTIIDEINSYFGVPQNKAVVGNLNNIKLASQSSAIPGLPPQFVFDFDLDNISATASNFAVTNVTVLDDTAADITSYTSTKQTVALDPLNTFNTTIGSNVVTVNTTAAHGFANGDVIYLGDPGVTVGGSISGSELNGFFTISNVTATSFDITVVTNATSAVPTNIVAQTATEKYDTINAGDMRRIRDEGTITASLAGNSASAYYDISVDVAVDDGLGTISTATVTYRVLNSVGNLLNDRYAATAVSGSGTLVQPSSTQAILRAILVDENGMELPKTNGIYNDQRGYLKIAGMDGSTTVAINELGSSEGGQPSGNPVIAASNRGFSHYFELNNFFVSNTPITGGDTLRGSAIHMAVEERITQNPNLITIGKLVRSIQPTDPSAAPLYTYERFTGDNSQIGALAGLGSQSIDFAAAGGLPVSAQSFAGYAGQILGYSAANAVAARDSLSSSQTLMDGFTERKEAISGVNIDEELANTIIYQNAYSASARVINVTQDMFDTLMSAFL